MSFAPQILDALGLKKNKDFFPKLMNLMGMTLKGSRCYPLPKYKYGNLSLAEHNW